MSRPQFSLAASRTALVFVASSLAVACARGAEPVPGDAARDARSDGTTTTEGGSPDASMMDAVAPGDGAPSMDAAPTSDTRPTGDTGPAGDGAAGRVCTNNGECAGTTTPVCDTVARRCVECLVGMESSCPGGTICDATTKRCVTGCRNDGQCMAAAADAGASEGGAPATLRCLLAERRCVECVLSDDCPPGRLCNANRCVSGCNPARPCPTGEACCSGMCTDLMSNAGACGACGTSCGSGEACCRGSCTGVLGDVGNCGGCGTMCAPSHGTGRCDMGMCRVAMCEAGWSDLDGDGSNGCECNAGETAPTCDGARMIEAIAPGDTREATGIVVRPDSDAWFRVNVSPGGFFRVRFNNNPSSKLRFEVRAGCDGTPAACLNRGEGATGLIDYDFRDLPGEHRTRNVPYPTAVFIRVFATEMLEGCQPFTIAVQN